MSDTDYAKAVAEFMSRKGVTRCPTVCVVVGEGGSGGALAAACADVLLMAPDSYLTALVAQVALYSAQQQLQTVRVTRLQNLVTLYKALGGGLREHAAVAERTTSN